MKQSTPPETQPNIKTKRPPLAIGNSDFKQIITNGYRFVDKSLLIKDIIDDSSEVKLIVRPRRFGKTSNLTMLNYFFAKTEDDNSVLFKDLKIWQEDAKYQQEQGKYPVVFLTFKDIKESTFEKAYEEFKYILSEQYCEHKQLLWNGILKDNDDDKRIYQKIIESKADDTQVARALKNLIKYLHKQYQMPVIVLIDEYDTPLHDCYQWASPETTNSGNISKQSVSYYQQMTEFMDDFLGSALKDNPYLHQAVLTGILPINFLGLNNAKVYSVLSSSHYAAHFGFSETEIKELLCSYSAEHLLQDIENYYGGYQIGEKNLSSPWSVVNFIDDYENKNKPLFRHYWISTSDNEVIKRLLTKASKQTQIDFQQLIRNEPIKKIVQECRNFTEMNETALWNFLLLTGYLTTNITKQLTDDEPLLLIIPNQELHHFYCSLNLNESAQNNPISLQSGSLEYIKQSMNKEDESTSHQQTTTIIAAIDNISNYKLSPTFFLHSNSSLSHCQQLIHKGTPQVDERNGLPIVSIIFLNRQLAEQLQQALLNEKIVTTKINVIMPTPNSNANESYNIELTATEYESIMGSDSFIKLLLSDESVAQLRKK